MEGVRSRLHATNRPAAPWRTGRASSIVVVLVMTFMSVAMLIPVMPAPVSAVVIVIAFLVPFAVLPALPLQFALALMILIVTLVFRIVFLRSDEVHGPITGSVFTAVAAPISRMLRRHVQINGRRRSFLRLDQRRLYVDDRRRTFVADIHLTV